MVNRMIDWEQINYDISKATKDYDDLNGEQND